ncbi:hypothetical protein V6U90_12665 [Micromonospora sp. CPCC 206060]|uniref:hypothetical protein n=1 Tax=Micromonospora sp. CPCC 206060 TaxID=3122406 RepID=UPI002FF2E95B
MTDHTLSPSAAHLPGPTPPSARPPRRHPAALVAGACLFVLAVTSYLVVVGTNAAHADRLVLDDADAVIWGQTIRRPVEIAADRVTLRRVSVQAGGGVAIRIRPGVTGTVIEDSEIRCISRGTDGIASGNYSAIRVRTFGCREPFRGSPDTPASVVGSTRDGAPYPDRSPGSEPAGTPVAPGPIGSSEAAVAPAPPAVQVAPTPITYWPGPTTTGVPAGTVLRASGSLNLVTPGQVISGLDITGCVAVRASNVIIRRSKITCNSTTYAIRVYAPAINLVVEDVEINGTGRTSATVCCGEYTLRRVNIHNTIDGPRVGNRTNILDSWIHDLARVTGSHNDALQTTGASNIVIRHNRLDAYKPSTADPMNACLMIGSEIGPSVTNLLFENNYCNGGNYSIGVRTDLVASNVRFRVNKFGRNYRYGIISRPNQAGIIWERSTNVWFDNGLPVIP